MARKKPKARERVCKKCGRRSTWKVKNGKCLFGCLGAKAKEPLIDFDNPPICEEDGAEMELGVNPETGNYSWGCPKCGWSYDVEGTNG